MEKEHHSRKHTWYLVVIISIVVGAGIFSLQGTTPTTYATVDMRKVIENKEPVLLIDEQCVDTDSKLPDKQNIHEKGSVLDMNGTRYDDSCVEYDNVKGKYANPRDVPSCKGKLCKHREGYCKKLPTGDMVAKEETIRCPPPYMCSDGKCLTSSAKARIEEIPRDIINIKLYK